MGEYLRKGWVFGERRPPPPSSPPILSVIFLLHIHSKVGAWIVEGAGTGRWDSCVPEGEGPGDGDTTPGSLKKERACPPPPPPPLHCWVLMEGRSSGYVRRGSGFGSLGSQKRGRGKPTPVLNVYLMRVTLFLFYGYPSFLSPSVFPHALPHPGEQQE